VALAIALVAPTSVGATETISRPARVVDADTVDIGSRRVRLKGVDGAERFTPRGDDATAIMRGIVGDSELRCELTGEKTWRRDVGYCFTADGRDIQREIIEMGAALACSRYSTRYVEFEQTEARAAHTPIRVASAEGAKNQIIGAQ
jgi:micrococcal nuclease